MNLIQTILMMSVVVMVAAEMQNLNQHDQDDNSLKKKRDGGECVESCPGSGCNLRLKI